MEIISEQETGQPLASDWPPAASWPRAEDQRRLGRLQDLAARREREVHVFEVTGAPEARAAPREGHVGDGVLEGREGLV